MPYQLPLPDGRVVTFPDDVKREQAQQYLRTDFSHLYPLDIPAPQEPPKEQGDFSRGFESVWPQTKALVGGTAALVGDTLGMEPVREYGTEVYQRNMAESQKNAKPTDSFFDTIKRGDLGGTIDSAQYWMGYGAAQAFETVAAGMVGSLLGGGVDPVTGAAGAAGKGALKKMVGAAVDKMVAKRIGDKVVSEEVRNQMLEEASKELTKKIGAGAAIYAQNATQELGGIYGEASNEAGGQPLSGDALAKVWAAGVAAATVETAADALGLERFFKTGAKGTGLKDVLTNTVKEVGLGIAREAPTEGVQTVLERMGAGQSLTDEDAQRDIINSMFAGAVGGGQAGVVTGIKHGVFGQPQETAPGAEQPPATPPTAEQPAEPQGPLPGAEEAAVQQAAETEQALQQAAAPVQQAPIPEPTLAPVAEAPVAEAPQAEPAPAEEPVPPHQLPFTEEDVAATGVKYQAKKWLTDNVLGKTPEQVFDLVQANPALLEGKGARAQLLTALMTNRADMAKQAQAPEVPEVQTTPIPEAPPVQEPVQSTAPVDLSTQQQPSTIQEPMAPAPAPTAVPEQLTQTAPAAVAAQPELPAAPVAEPAALVQPAPAQTETPVVAPAEGAAQPAQTAAPEPEPTLAPPPAERPTKGKGSRPRVTWTGADIKPMWDQLKAVMATGDEKSPEFTRAARTLAMVMNAAKRDKQKVPTLAVRTAQAEYGDTPLGQKLFATAAEMEESMHNVPATHQQSVGKAEPDEGPMYRPGEGRGLPLVDLLKQINTTTQNWRSRSSVQAVQSLSHLPTALQEQVRADNAENAAGFVSPDGTIHLIADNMGSHDEAVATLYHEGMHKGLAAKFKARLDAVLQQIFNSNKKLRAEAEAWSADNPGAYEGRANPHLRALEEVLAHRGEAGLIDAGVWQRIVAVVKHFGRLMGLKLDYTDGEVAAILRSAQQAGMNERGARTAQSGNRYMYSEGRPEEPAEAGAEAQADEYDDDIPNDNVAQTVPNSTRAVRSLGDKLGDMAVDVLGPKAEPIVDKIDSAFRRGVFGNTKNLALGSLPLPSLVDLVKKQIPQATLVNRVARSINGEIKTAYEQLGVIRKQLVGWAKANADKYKFLNQCVFNGTEFGIDLRKDISEYKHDKEKYDAYLALRNDKTKTGAWYEMGKGGQQAYAKMRTLYDRLFDEIIKQVEGDIGDLTGDAALTTKLHNEFFKKLTEKGRLEGFAPMRRAKGDYFLAYDATHHLHGTLEPHFEIFETHRARRRAMELMEANPPKGYVKGTARAIDKLDGTVFQNSPSMSFVNNMLKTMDAHKGKTPQERKNMEAAIQSMLRLVVETSPQSSLTRMLSHRKGTAGYINDSVKAFDMTVFNLKRKEIMLRHRADLRNIQEALALHAKENIAVDRDYYRELGKRIDFMMDPYLPSWNRAIQTGVYGMTLGFNVSSALVDMATIPMSYMPMLQGMYSGQSVTRAISDATRLFLGGGRTHQIESYITAGLTGAKLVEARKAALMDMNDTSVVDHPAFYSIANYDFSKQGLPAEVKELQPLVDIARQFGQFHRFSIVDDADIIDAESKLAKINAFQGIPMQASERSKREIGMVAAYQLELEKMRKGGQTLTENDMRQAAEKAIDFIELTSGGSSILAAPRWSQGAVSSIPFMYKKYGALSYYLQFKMMREMLSKESDPVVRSRAMHQMMYTMASSALFSGMRGLPMMGVLAMMYNLFRDDEDDDFNTLMRKLFGNPVHEGAINTLFNINVADRIGLTNMMWRDSPVNQNLAPSAAIMQTFGGPLAGTIDRVWKGGQLVSQGNVERGVEQMLPVVLSNAMKSYRLATEGARNLRGDPIIADMSPGSIMAQAIGLAPADYARAQEITGFQKTLDKKASERRTKLMERFFVARTFGDPEGMQEARDDIRQFNTEHKEHPIRSGDLQRSVTQRKKSAKVAAEYYGKVPDARRRKVWDAAFEDIGIDHSNEEADTELQE